MPAIFFALDFVVWFAHDRLSELSFLTVENFTHRSSHFS
jgi:hypothetical protein